MGYNTSTPVSVIRSLYDALAAGDVTGLDSLLDEHLAPSAILRLPPGLPYGGTLSGKSMVTSIFSSAAGRPPVGPLSPEIESLAGTDDVVFAEVRFTWAGAGGGEESRAIEKWDFADGKIIAITAYYWDPAACPTPARSAQNR
ncbi:nuclear transport factor 2 family protein [Rhodococcus pyridinivorans]|uniref:nuclear transport factor 2 family protein n=1 Tax=Rhodococcus pyridinivorans TaxID=103816 RepID=UPI000AEB0EEB|nr:nuclear transport factor 2 family protein [Rhodococcus pyridinivorans]